MGCEGTPTQICTCSSDFLLRMMMRGAILGGEPWKPFFDRLHVREMFGHQFHELLVLQMTGSADDHVAGRETLPVEIQHRIALEFLDRVSCVPRIGLPEGVIFPEILGEDFVDQIVGIVLVHLYFFEDDAALAADVVRHRRPDSAPGR